MTPQPTAQVDICLNPIFIIGSPRSGTTILFRALAQHSQLWGSRESHFTFYFFRRSRVIEAYKRATARPTDWLSAERVEPAELLAHLGIGLNALFTNRSKGKRWIDKTPINTMMVDDLAEMFPDALFLHLLRDGRRVTHSLVNLANRRPPERLEALRTMNPRSSWGSGDFRQACRTWARYVERASNFCARNTTRTLTVVNEKIVADPDSEFRRIFDFLGIRHEDAAPQFFHRNKVNSSFATDDVVEAPLFEPWHEWPYEQRLTFAKEAGKILVASGFASAADLRRWVSDGDGVIA